MSLPLCLVLVALEVDVRAAGVVVSPRPERSSAVLRSGGVTRVVAPGETAFGMRVLAVSEHAVTVEVDGRTLVLGLAGGPTAAVPAPAPATAAATSGAPGERVMDRADVERRIALEAPRILAETTLMPVYNGSQAGLTLSRIPQGLLTEAGLQPGDVLVSVNGTAVDSLPSLLSLWPRLQGADTIQAEVLRGGRPLQITVRLK